MTAPSPTTITHVAARRWDIPMLEPFGIATGAQATAHNVLVRVTLADGTRGLGEAAPFPAVNGETQDDALTSIRVAAPVLVGTEGSATEAVHARLRELDAAPSARCALESALFDALSRRAGAPLWRWWGGAEHRLHTDVTITTGTAEEAARAAARWAGRGFDLLKVKVGGVPFDLDVARVRAVAGAAPGARLLIDANAAMTARDAIALARSLGAAAERLVALEQPVAADDHDGLALVGEAGFRVVADESARSVEDVVALARVGVWGVNHKITKTGVVQTLEMARTAASLGLHRMIGGMVESRLCMTVSACLAGGLGGFDLVDLDTPLFLDESDLEGGFDQTGPDLSLAALGPGHGVALRPRAEAAGEW